MKWSKEFDDIVIGSGAGGATVAWALGNAGRTCALLEEGAWVQRGSFREDMYTTINHLFRDQGMLVARGKSVIPVLAGRCVGGSTVMNGAIVHRFPEEVFSGWQAQHGVDLSYDEIDQANEKLEPELGVKRNLEPVLPQLPLTKTLQRKGWRYQAMQRNAPGCQGSGRCLQGCPSGGKWSMENSLIPRAMKKGVAVYDRHRVIKVVIERGRAVGVLARAPKGIVAYRARKGIFLCAGVVHTPGILQKSGYRHSELGKHFQVHLSVGAVGLTDRAVRDVEGPPQGIEVFQFKNESIKLATQLLPPEMVLARSPLVGQPLVEAMKGWRNVTSWMGSVSSEAKGRVQFRFGRPKIQFQPTAKDLSRSRAALSKLGELLFDLGAKNVYPGVMGDRSVPLDLSSPDQLPQLESIPNNSRNYLFSVGHLFGTCRLGGDEQKSVVNNRFEVNGVKQLHVLDASLFPTPVGVNPQHSIMALVLAGTERVLNA